MKLTQDTIIAILDAITGAGGPFDPAALFVGVYQSIVDNGQATAMADVTEGTGDMAIRIDVTAWGAFIRMNNNKWYQQATPPAIFAPADETEAQTIAGWFLASAASAGTLKAWGAFPAPIEVIDSHSQITIIPRIVCDPAGVWSSEVVIDG